MRIGMGYDVHRLVDGRPLVLGGVEIPYKKGLLGHSDADVLTHAVCDALLGAVGLGDIGEHFPDTDEKYKGIDSIILLRQCFKLVQAKGYDLRNLDATVIAQAPKLSPYKTQIRHMLAEVFNSPIDCISVKATTTDGLGFIGAEDGIAAMCIVLICPCAAPPQIDA